MGKKPRDKNKVRKTKVPPVPNQGDVTFNLYLMPEPKEKGGQWSEPIQVTGRNRRRVAGQVREDYKNRGWKLRKT
jgi:hypothetical protein